MNNDLITVYTQAYNSEKYIGKCIESILGQTYKNFEYFICDHGSTDRTGEIINEYASKDNRIKKFTMSNSARGFYPDYIKANGNGTWFVMLDSDDFVRQDYLEKLLLFAKSNSLDIAVCGVASFTDNSEDYEILRQVKKSFTYDISQNCIYFPIIYGFLRTTWGKIIKMEDLKKADFTWYKKNAETFICDDTAFTLACYAQCKRIGAIPDLLQYYRFSDSSVTANYKQTLFENNHNIYLQTLELFEQINDTSYESLKVAQEIWEGGIKYTFNMLIQSKMSIESKLKEILRIVSTELFDNLGMVSEKLKVTEDVNTYLDLLCSRKIATDADYDLIKKINECIHKNTIKRWPSEASEYPILSISMLCNGKHKEETKKCLESLMTIKNRLASELIVVDTGCDDEMHDLLGQYADKIVPFKWCDDFAKARNAGLKECTGEWFMYVDDDEWFENTDELVAFFTSGEYRQYKQAAYIVRNYLNADGTEYDDFWAGRMTVLTSKTHFEGEIHEYLAPLEGECKMIHSFEHHYGYVYKDKKDHYAKAVRNIKPLIDMINKDPGNLHWYSQLIQEYLAIGDAGRLSDLCDRLIKESDKIDDPEMNWARADFYNGKLWADNHLYQYDQTISDFNSFRKDHRNDEICNASLYFNAISAFYELKDYDNAERYCKKYMQIYEKWQKYDDFDERVNEGSLTTRYIFRERYLWPVISILIETGLKRDDPAELDRYFDKLSSLKNGGKQYDLVYEQIIDFFARAEFQDRYVSYADRMLSYVDSFQKCTEYLIELGKKDKREHTGTTEKLIKVFGQTKNGRNYYLDFLRVRYEAEYGTDRDALLDKYKSLIFMTNDFLNLDASIWQIAKDKDIDLGAIFKQIPLKKWYRVVDEYFSKHTDEQTKNVREFMSTLSDDEDIRFRFFRLKQKETEIAHEKNAASAAEKLSAYCDECIRFYKEIYAKDQFTADESASMLPAECEFAVEFKRAAEISDPCRKEAKLSECGKVFAPFTSALKEYLKKEAAGRQTFIFIIYKAEQMNALESLFDACDADTQSRAIVLPIPYYDKKPDGTLGEYHFEKDAIPEKYHTVYFADTDLEKMHPDVIFISAQMDGGNPKAAVPAEFYADVLKKYTRMLVYVPEEVIEKPGMGEKVFGQVKEQLKRL